jgi:hypothetical protein
MDQGTLKAAAFLSKSVTGGFVVNGQIMNALNCILLSNDDSAVNLSRQILESINKICGNLLNESANQQFTKPEPKVNQQDQILDAISQRASDLCW